MIKLNVSNITNETNITACVRNILGFRITVGGGMGTSKLFHIDYICGIHYGEFG